MSSTEWNYPLRFSPDVFFDISATIDIKLAAMEKYQSELREYPNPRSIKGIRLNAEHWGMKAGLNYAEAFKLVRYGKVKRVLITGANGFTGSTLIKVL